MEETTRQRLVSSDIWIRALYMVLFAVAFGIARFIIGFLVVFQFFAVLFTGRANEPLLQFGKNLTVYIYEILEFQTFNTELHPFPFSTWPDEEPGGEAWLDDTDIDVDADIDDELDASETTADPDDTEDVDDSHEDSDEKDKK
ncbi:MAG: DUF4389 domain-containing protein [Gammaproteobacteria bacterium]|nr:DUF4389 domain-containing protein [Gammaproteobacteria bacterium]